MEKIKLFVGTPMHGGMCYGAYANSCINLASTMNRMGVFVLFYYYYNDALVSRARNNIVDQFLRTDCTHLLFIDADIQFNPQDVVSILQQKADVIGGPYAKKMINWKKVVQVIKDIPNIDPNNVEKFAGDGVFSLQHPLQDVHTLQEVKETGAGFLLIHRSVFLKMKDAYPSLRYEENGEEKYCFFPTLIDSHGSVTDGGTDRYLSEDYAFCSLWRKMGGKIMLAPWIVLKHIGNYSYTCDFSFVMNTYLQK
jgi:hypothetical protein